VRRSSRFSGLAAAAIATTVAGLYAVLIDPEPGEQARVTVVALSLAAAALLAAYGSVAQRAIPLGAATGLLLVWGLLGMASIGMPLLVAGVLAFVACGDTQGRQRVWCTLVGAVAGFGSAAIALLRT